MTSSGITVKAITIRRLLPVTGNETQIKGTDRLDLIAHRKYGDATKFWYIADANTELIANALIKNGRIMKVPDK